MPIHQRILAWIIKVGVILIGYLPQGVLLFMGRSLARLAYWFMKNRRQVALDNLQHIYSQTMNERQKKTVAKQSFLHLGEIAMEALAVAGAPHRLRKFCVVNGLENLNHMLNQKKGVVIFSAHLGNFLLLTAALSQHCDFKILYRSVKEPLANHLYAWLRNRLGVAVIRDNPRHLCIFHAYRHIENKGAVAILIDQVETGGLYVDFMGKPAGSTLGAANLALKTGAPLLPVYCIRNTDGRLEINIEEEHSIKRNGTHEELLFLAVSSMNQKVSEWVWQTPGQWMWGHRRWRAWRK